MIYSNEHERRNELIKHLFSEGYSLQQLSRILLWEREYLTKYCNQHGIDTNRYDKIEVPKNLDQLMIGSLLGDGGISKPNAGTGACYYMERHSSKQKDYSEWKFNLLGDFKRSITEGSKNYTFPNGYLGEYGHIDIKSTSHPYF